MNREQVKKELAEYLQSSFGRAFANIDFDELRKVRRDSWLARAESLMEVLEHVGYRLIPELKVLGDEEIKAVLDEAYRKIVVGELSQQGMKEYNRNFLRWVAQAQRDYDQKQIKGESCATSAGN